MRKLLAGLTAFLLFTGQLLAQKTISGTVTDGAGKGIPDVSVQVKGTSTGTITKENGTYTISVPADATALVFSAVGLVTQEINIGNKSNISISLESTDRTMQEVVVVGYGTQQRKAFTGAAAKVDVKDFANLMTPSVDKQLGGRAAGVQVITSGGLVNTPATIRIRGINSVNQSNSPLIVLDGVPMIDGNLAGATNSNALADINPADIESMDVLKDGSATAIYGSRAAGGVILITTKKGLKGRAKVTYDGFLGFSSALKTFHLLDADLFVLIANEKLRNAGLANRANPSPDGINTDWQGEVMVNQAPAHSHTLSVQGSGEKTNYYLSVGYSDQKGIITSNFNKAYRVRLNLEHEASRFVKLGNNLTVSRQEDGDQNNGSNALSGAIASALRLLPNVSPYNPNHPSGYNINYPTSNAMNPGSNTTSLDDNFTNVAFTVRENKFLSDKYRIINNTFLEITPIKNLKLRSQFGWDYFGDYSYQGTSPFHGDGYGTSTGGTNGRVVNTSQNITRLVWQNYLNYNFSVKDHNVYFTGGTELQMDKSKNFSLNNNNISDVFFINGQNFVSGTAAIQATSGGLSENTLQSVFGRINYDYQSKYFLQVTVRRDGLSALAEDDRYGTFPGASVGWRPSEETFWKNSSFLNKWIPQAKLKGSYAEVGNSVTGYRYQSTFGSRPYGNIPGISVGSIGNPALLWETNDKYDVGIELGVWNNRFTLTADWFKNDINNIIFGVPTPVSAGIPGNSIDQNVGRMTNQGIELSVSGNVLQKGDFRWDFNANFTSLKNEMQQLYEVGGVPVQFTQNGNYNIMRVGDPINIIYGNRWAGVNSANGNPMYYKADGSLVQLNLNPAAGTVGTYFVATGKDNPALGAQSSLTFADRANLGVVQPKWYGGFGSTFSWKGLSADVLFRYSGGNKIMNITRQEALLNQSFQNNGKEILERWMTPGQITDVPKLYYGQGNNINQTSLANSRFVEKGDFLRLQNITISYLVPSKKLSAFTNNLVSSLRIYAQGQNLAVWTKYKGVDPENISTLGLDNAVSPQVRTYSFGLSVGF